ncbi:MAG: hypothetical protein HYX48_08175 [Chlamydiales bacterium]|nr:hypothetical protein [Chlamydiales bacterium]
MTLALSASRPISLIDSQQLEPAHEADSSGAGLSDYLFGSIWILLLVDSLFKLISSLYRVASGEEEVGRDLALTATTFTCISANSLHWADSVRVISLGAVAPFARAVGYGSSALLSLFAISDALCVLLSESNEAREQEKILALFDLGNRISMFAWSILGIISLFVEEALLPSLSIALFLSSFLFLTASYIYRNQFMRPEREALPVIPQPV